MRRSLAAPFALALLLALPSFALEGKWTPDQVLRLDAAALAAAGLEIPPATLWDDARGEGLLSAAVKINGCSAGFISSEGLVVTNHHCAFGILQQHSTPADDIITNGFLAADRAAELAGGGVKAQIPHHFTDVTAAVAAAVPAGADDLARYRAVERKEKELVAACEASPDRRCTVARFDGGSRYVLVEALEYPDVRLVFAPPRSVGEYGGEVDNWMWPRHTGDFALLRVYAAPDGRPAPRAAGNVPLRPRHFFPVATTGVGPDTFVMVAGYPGRTFRSLTAAEMAERAELFYPARAALYRSWLDIMEARSARSDAARIALASRAKSLANGEKNARGQVAGLARGHALGHKRAAEAEVLAWVGEHPELAEAAVAHAALAAEVEAARATWQRDFLLEQMTRGPLPLDLALTLVRWAREGAKPDMDRDPAFMERNRATEEASLRRAGKRLDPVAERALLTDVLLRFDALPAGERSAAVDTFLAGAHGGEAVAARAGALLDGTRVTDESPRMAMFSEDTAALHARHDPLLELAFALDGERAELETRRHRHEGAVERLRPAWLAAVRGHAGTPVSPDANGTLRVSFAHVQGYSPRDAVWMLPQTTLAGVVEKNTGAEPFNSPAALLAAASAAGRSRWADARLHDVPVAFLADADTTGGNSGSPVLNGRGELVGVNFDRVWENVANDFAYDPAVARNVSVDVRYLLWTLETLGGAKARPVLTEMGVAEPPVN